MNDVFDFPRDSHGQGRTRRVAALAGAQGGPISYEQLRALGVSEDAIEYWLSSGRLHRRYRGVYVLGHTAMTSKGRLMAAVLACGKDAVVSHACAAIWWGFWKGAEPPDPQLTVPGRTGRKRKGIERHFVRSLDPRDHTVRFGVPVTTVPRTLLDLAEAVPLWRLRLLVDEADRRNLFNAEAVHRLLQRSPGRKGLKPLSLLLSDFETVPLLRSELEKLFRDVCEQYELPLPETNVEVEGFEVDAY